NGANGIHAQGVAGIILENITAQNNAVTGIFVVGDSSASISNSSALNNGVDGVDAEDSSSLIFTGSFTAQVFGINLGATSSATLNSATNTASQNVLGIQISLSSGMFLADPGCTINAVNNFTTGLTVVSGAHLFNFGGKIVASGNGINGISLFSRSGFDMDAASLVSSFNNQQDGVHLDELSTRNLFNTPAFSGVPGTTTLQVYNNAMNGISTLLNSQVHMFNQTAIQSHDNTGSGLQVDNGSSLTLLDSTIAHNKASDVTLSFGSRGEFTKNTIGTLTCDASSLIRGDTGKTCP
ncbi:MAG TPA: right-handed parallel beta-helix repeat-containing protein, partial [Bryobacteraceae bacterium]|nr:right-handed parallel beta-helix repeat-containing protein [Bryobacteraceae bacterium]